MCSLTRIRAIAAIGFAALIVLTSNAYAKQHGDASVIPNTPGVKPLIGIGDNSPAMFADPNYQSLHTTISRKFVAWDFYKHPSEVEDLDSWVAAANASGVEQLITFGALMARPSSYRLISVPEYLNTLNILLARYPTVRTISPWNEANHSSQPTWNHPRQLLFTTTRRERRVRTARSLLLMFWISTTC